MLKKLNKRIAMKKSKIVIDIKFKIKNELIYHVKNDVKRLCILFSCEKIVFEQTHDLNNHAEYHRAYQKFVNAIYISKLSRKIRQYVKYCFFCELNQIKKHVTYEKLMSIISSTIPFRTVIMNFIVTLSKKINSILIVTCKIFKRVSIIFEKFT